MTSCEELTEQLTDYLEGRLPYGEKIGIWIHLMMCEHCRRYYNQFKDTIDYAGELDSDAESDSLDEETKESIMDAYRERGDNG
jgi:predicted anti-sigma-YlaC factor YlaD